MEYLTKIETYIKEIKLMGKSILETNRKDDDDHDYLPDPCRLVNVHLRDHSIHWWMCTLRKRVFKDHFNRHPFIGNHRILLIKAITAGYLEIRIHHATKTFEPKEKNRNVHNKLVLFKGK
ncbi:hypothetical protein SFRURICE_001266 [Spodoptera frugiperda]|nr:hypothetical protein SFRURICE_001266 [Spodoptera frugiperda]